MIIHIHLAQSSSIYPSLNEIHPPSTSLFILNALGNEVTYPSLLIRPVQGASGMACKKLVSREMENSAIMSVYYIT